MDDKQIIDLFLNRSEKAIAEVRKKFGRYCHYISYNILHNDEDAEGCVNDTFIKVWQSIPPNNPKHLAAFIGKITRNLSLDRYEKYNAKKRGGGQLESAFDELRDCLPGTDNTTNIADDIILKEALNKFLWSLPIQIRKIFIRRYWYMSTIKEISSDFNISESKTKMVLMRTRNSLKNFLEKEGIVV